MQTFSCDFSAREQGKTIKRQFRSIKARDTYEASDHIKALIPNYAALTHPVFQFRLARKSMPRGLASIVAKAGPEEE